MKNTATFTNKNIDVGIPKQVVEASQSGVVWPAIIAGAITATAISIVLLFLGSGLGMAAMSPWPNLDSPMLTFTMTAAIWLIIMQAISSAVGGYITGRLRIKWVRAHTNEVFFRDSSHGFLAWAIAMVFTALVAGTGAYAVATGVDQSDEASSSAYNSGLESYYIDKLFRVEPTSAVDLSGQIALTAPVIQEDVRNEVNRILIMGSHNREMAASRGEEAANIIAPEDRTYISRLVAARTNLSPDDSAARVDSVLAQVTADKDAVSKAGTYLTMFLFLSMVVSAFLSSSAAVVGGKHRDRY